MNTGHGFHKETMVHRIRKLALCCIIATTLRCQTFGQTSKGYALVLGNGAYEHATPLTTPPADAYEVSQALTQLGFIVTSNTNLDLQGLRTAIRNWRTSLSGIDAPTVFYYAGHGVQINGVDYMLPTDIAAQHAAEIPSRAVALDDVFSSFLGSRTKPFVVILDACRANPFSTIASTEWVPGLAIPSNAPANALLAFATAPGMIAADGIGVHSPYTRSLLRHITLAGTAVQQLFEQVRNDVIANTDGLQVPWENTSLTGPFFFRDPAVIYGQINNADDDALMLINGEEVLDWNNDSNRRKPIALRPGKNELVIKVYNQRSYTGGIPPFGHQPEGWNYSAVLSNASGSVLKTLSDGENRPADNGPHHGKLFTVARFQVTVDEQSGVITFVQEQ